MAAGSVLLGGPPPSMTPASAQPSTPGPDSASRNWVAALEAGDEEAGRRLYALLLRAARFEIGRRRATLPHLRGDDFDDLAHQAASDAMLAILRKLDTYRGDSRFTTWAYKFALLEAAVKLRRRSWQGREVPIEAEQWEVLHSAAESPSEDAETRETLEELSTAVEEQLTPHQREVLVAVALNGVPIDVLAERLDTTRGALYKTIHDARKKLRSHLAEQGLRFTDDLEPDEGS
jgi:RNA polymerase sigma-70 factor, ECF subfamily